MLSMTASWWWISSTRPSDMSSARSNSSVAMFAPPQGWLATWLPVSKTPSLPSS